MIQHLHVFVRQVNSVLLLQCCVIEVTDFYRVTACNAMHGIAVAMLSICLCVRLLDACIVTELNLSLIHI